MRTYKIKASSLDSAMALVMIRVKQDFPDVTEFFLKFDGIECTEVIKYVIELRYKLS